MEGLGLAQVLLFVSGAALLVAWMTFSFLVLRIRRDHWDSRADENRFFEFLLNLADRQQALYDEPKTGATPVE